MDDLEITKACAKAMGIKLRYPFKGSPHMPCEFWHERDTSDNNGALKLYWPLENDAQAMPMIKKFMLRIQEPDKHSDNFCRVTAYLENGKSVSKNIDLNRAICLCVAGIPPVEHGREG